MRVHAGAAMVLLLAAAGPAIGQDVGACVGGGQAMAARLEAVHEAQRNVGLQAALWWSGEVVWSESWGQANRETGSPVRRDTRFGIASVSKAFTGAAILRLIASGDLSVDDTLGHHLPGLPGAVRGVTLGQLVRHTSGLPHNSDRTPELYARHFTSATSALDAMPLDTLESVPGSAYGYASTNYNVLAAVVEQATGTRFEDHVIRTFIAPLGLRHTGFEDVRDRRDHVALRYTFYDPWTRAQSDTVLRVPDWDYTFNSGAGNMHATAEDLVRFAGAFAEPGFWSESAWERLWRQEAPSPWSYGWYLGERRLLGQAERYLFISGANPGVQAALVVFPRLELALAVLSNTWGIGSRSGDMVDVRTFMELCLEGAER